MEITETHFKISGEENLRKYINDLEGLYHDKLKTLYPSDPAKRKLHPYTRELIEDYIKRTDIFDRMWGPPGYHAEVLAVNDVFNHLDKLGIDPRSYDLKKIKVATYHTKGSKAGTRFEACMNCQNIIIEDIDIFTGRKEYD